MRTPSSRSRFRRPGAILALLVLAAAAWIAATGLASANTSGHRAAKLALVGRDPATVRGTGFKPRTRVRVTFDGTQALVRRPPGAKRPGSVHGDVPDGRRSLHGVVGLGEPARTRDRCAEGTGEARVRAGLDAVAWRRARSAEGAGFEPAVRFHGLWFSRPAHSTALPPLRGFAGPMLALRTCQRCRCQALHCPKRLPGEVAEWLKALAC